MLQPWNWIESFLQRGKDCFQSSNNDNSQAIFKKWFLTFSSWALQLEVIQSINLYDSEEVLYKKKMPMLFARLQWTVVEFGAAKPIGNK